MFKTLLSCMQLRSLPMGISTVLMGTAAATLTGSLEVEPAVLCLLFVIFMQISANVFHRYCDEKYHYGENIDDGIANGESGGVSLERILRESSIAFGMVAMVLGLSLIVIAPGWTIAVAAVIVLSVYFNNAGPRPLTRTPWNLTLTFLVFGPIGVITTAYIQAVSDGDVSDVTALISPAFYLGTMAGCFACNCLLYYGYSTYEKAVKNASRSFTVTYGLKTTRNLFLFNSLFIFALSCVVCVDYHFSNVGLAMVAPVVCTLCHLYIWWRMKYPERATGALGTYIPLNMLLFAVASFLLFYYLGAPNDNIFDAF